MARPRESQLRKGALELAVLALIARSEPDGVYGGALVERLAARFSVRVSAIGVRRGVGNVYAGGSARWR